MDSKYEVKQYSFSFLDGRVSVPRFQRDLVWNQTSRESFIDSIKKGFPFGSILVYRTGVESDVLGLDGEQAKYTLIDGLQRFKTIQDLREHPDKYFPVDQYSEALVRIAGYEESDSDFEMKVERAQTVLRSLVSENASKAKQGEGGADYVYLFKAIQEHIGFVAERRSEMSVMTDSLDFQKKLLNEVEEYLNVGEVVIPTIIFKGSPSELAEVFTRLNEGGTKLSSYQVFAAQWFDTQLRLPDEMLCNDLVRTVINRYEYLESDNGGKAHGLSIDDFNATEMSESRTISLPEFLYGLGYKIVSTLDSFYGEAQRSNKADLFGYMTAAIVFGVDVRKLDTLRDACASILTSKQFDHELMIQSIIEVFATVDSALSKRLRGPGQSKRIPYPGGVKDLQLLSFFAALWRLRYSIVDGRIEQKENYKRSGYDSTISNLIKWYVYDSIQKNWRSAGDSRLASYYYDASRSYSAPPNRSSFSEALKTWVDDSTQMGSVNRDALSTMILAVWASFSDSDYQANEYDVEHIVVKKRLNKRLNGKPIYSTLSIPGGSLGNLMFLGDSGNRSKGELTLYEYASADGVAVDETVISVSKYPTRDQLNEIHLAIDNGSGEAATSWIRDRANMICKELVDKFFGEQANA